MRTQLSFIIIVLFINTTYLVAQNSINSNAKKAFTTSRIINNEPPIIDGTLDDYAWDIVEWAKDFIENEPDENTEPNE